MPNELQKGNVSIVSRKFCNSSQSYSGSITEGMVCANGINNNGIVDVCQGDSGGPLVCNGKLVGLASFGVQCSYSLNFPGVHTNVYYYRSWIEKEILQNSANKIKYYVHLLFLLSIVLFV
jgi:trypsin